MSDAHKSDARAALRIVRDCYVVLDYALYDDDGELIEATDEAEGKPIGYVHGYGSLVPGLELGVTGMAAGETKNLRVMPAEGYGSWDEAAETWVDRSELPADVEVDDEFDAEGPDGKEMTLKVIELTDDAALVDANHPLAGEVLHFDVVVRSVRLATAKEVRAAQASARTVHLTLATEPTSVPGNVFPVGSVGPAHPDHDVDEANRPPTSDPVEIRQLASRIALETAAPGDANPASSNPSQGPLWVDDEQ